MQSGLTAGDRQAVRQSDEMQVNFKIFLYTKTFDFSLRLAKVQHHYSSTNAFQVLFSVKVYCKVVFQSAKIHEAI